MVHQEWERVIWLWCPSPTSLIKHGSSLQKRGTNLSPFLSLPPPAPLSLCLSPYLHPPPDVWTQASVFVPTERGRKGGCHPPIPFTWVGFLVKMKRCQKYHVIGEKPYQFSSDQWQVFASVKNLVEELSAMPLHAMMGQQDQTQVWGRNSALIWSRFRMNIELNLAGKVVKNAFAILSEFWGGFK